jgi:hypothetical protein
LVTGSGNELNPTSEFQPVEEISTVPAPDSERLKRRGE